VATVGPAKQEIPTWARHGMIGAAIVCFILALLCVWWDKVAAGTLAAGLFVVVVLMLYLPEMESFKAFGLEAKMRARLNEAEKLLRDLQAAGSVLGKVGYHVFGYGSRMSHPVKVKQEIADQIDKLLLSFGTTEAELAAMKATYIRFGLFDLYEVLYRISGLVIERMRKRLDNRRAVMEEGDSGIAEVRLRDQGLEAFYKNRSRDFLVADFRMSCLALVPQGLMDVREEKILRSFAERVADMGEKCKASGRIYEEAADFIETEFGRSDHVLAEQLFGKEFFSRW